LTSFRRWVDLVSGNKTATMGKYINLFEVRIHQKFYGDFTMRDLEITPSSETISLMAAFHLLFKQIPDGFIILLDTEKQFLLERQKEELRLAFSLKNTNRHFETFTRLVPLNPLTKYFFNNLRPPESGGDGLNPLKLHEGEEAGDTELGRFALSDTDPRLWVGTDNITLEQQGVQLFDSAHPTKVPFVLSRDLEKGWFVCRNNDSGESIKGCKVDDSFRLAFGLIELHVGGIGQVAFENVKESKYEIRFANRPIFWHYYLISESGSPPEEVNIFCGKDKIPFSPSESVKLINGQRATKVMSLQAMPLKSVYGDVLYRAEYSYAASDGMPAPVHRQINLPTPDAGKVKGRRLESGDEYFWEAFVYI